MRSIYLHTGGRVKNIVLPAVRTGLFVIGRDLLNKAVSVPYRAISEASWGAYGMTLARSVGLCVYRRTFADRHSVGKP